MALRPFYLPLIFIETFGPLNFVEAGEEEEFFIIIFSSKKGKFFYFDCKTRDAFCSLKERHRDLLLFEDPRRSTFVIWQPSLLHRLREKWSLVLQAIRRFLHL
ncbi:MAG: hypothetical protein G01um101418_999 [Parcubacteria group bacterium Gr01-1014_18]|nr:MAG: hypothetical protein Greene041636_994 [Parcubacteria group bacterium Greene0416_36]TSC79325.1 MAG: hypothetical protein G01um101418_999 [Parcubacteria group bacterium Gr01-1014_18]TSD05948.1 MAG: hypothetical protein Greene07142_983 [Parcubacteria group bacterium Greene0714_2]